MDFNWKKVNIKLKLNIYKPVTLNLKDALKTLNFMGDRPRGNSLGVLLGKYPKHFKQTKLYPSVE